MSIVLGYSAYFHDSSACIFIDGELKVAICEERLSRIKHDSSFPKLAIEFCLRELNISSLEIDEIVFYEKPFTKFERIFKTHLFTAPFSFKAFRKFISSWLKSKFWVEDEFRKHFKTNGLFSFAQHHLSHAALGCFSSGFASAAYLVIDGVGERATISYGTFKNGTLSPLKEQQFPHSIGLLYSAFTQYCGFKVNSGEYKLMGLAPYGKPIYTSEIWENFVSINEEAELQLNLKNFGFLRGEQMISRSFENVFGVKRREPNDEMLPFYMDIAASIQKVTEELVLKIIQEVYKCTKESNLVYSGGVALNCVINASISKLVNFDKIHVHSASGDSGCSIGAALLAGKNEGIVFSGVNNDYLGPNFKDHEIESVLRYESIPFERFDDEHLYALISQKLQQDQVVGWFQGKMEFGPRALGNRSILASPMKAEMKQKLNKKIKKREGFRPFAPIVLDSFFTDFFEDQGVDYSKMVYVTKARQHDLKIEACIHEDGTSRVQRLKYQDNAKMHELLSSFYDLTGCPVLINTSFNERGEPIVCSPLDAIRCFLNTDMDFLVLNNFVIEKRNLNLLYHKPISYDPD